LQSRWLRGAALAFLAGALPRSADAGTLGDVTGSIGANQSGPAELGRGNCAPYADSWGKPLTTPIPAKKTLD